MIFRDCAVDYFDLVAKAPRMEEVILKQSNQSEREKNNSSKILSSFHEQSTPIFYSHKEELEGLQSFNASFEKILALMKKQSCKEK